MVDPSYTRPFAGIRVIDFSQGLAGPYCGQMLAAYGADVIKVEPREGDWSRQLGTRHGAHTALEMAVNRGKRSIALDLKSDAGRDAALSLINDSDVIIESFRPGAADRLGIGFEQVSALNPRALYVSINGYGRTGPYAQRSCTDTVAQAFSGIMALNRDGHSQPQRVGIVLVDTVTAMFAFQAVATSLYARRNQGRLIDVSLMQSAAAFLAPKIVEQHLEGEAPRALNAPAGSYQTADGWIAVTLVRESHFPAICGVLSRPDLVTDRRFADPHDRADSAAELIAIVRDIIRARPSAVWLEAFAKAGVLCNPINDLAAWRADPHVKAVDAAPMMPQDAVGAIPLPRLPGQPSDAVENLTAGAPVVGEHTIAILRELGYDAVAIDNLRAAKVIADEQAEPTALAKAQAR